MTSLVKKLDSQAKAKKYKGFVIVLTDEADDTSKKLKEVAEKEGIKNLPLTMFENAAGPPKYKIAKDADVTVVMWIKGKVEVNHAFKAGGLDDKAIETVLADVYKAAGASAQAAGG